MSRRNYWTTLRQRKISRRTMLGASAKAGVGVAGLALVGCGDDDEPDAGAAAAERAAAAAEEAAAAAVAAGEARAADSEAAAAVAAEAADAAAEAADAAGEASDAAAQAAAAAADAAALAAEAAESEDAANAAAAAEAAAAAAAQAADAASAAGDAAAAAVADAAAQAAEAAAQAARDAAAAVEAGTATAAAAQAAINAAAEAAAAAAAAAGEASAAAGQAAATAQETAEAAAETAAAAVAAAQEAAEAAGEAASAAAAAVAGVVGETAEFTVPWPLDQVDLDASIVGVVPADQGGLDQHRAGSFGQHYAHGAVLSSPLDWDPLDGQSVPSLAAPEWIDATSIRASVRPAPFHDGSILTAHDMVFSYDRAGGLAEYHQGGATSDHTGGWAPANPGRSARDWVRNEAVDDRTWSFELPAPDAGFFIINLTGVGEIAVMSQADTERRGDAAVDQALMGTGPYRFVSHEDDTDFVFERFEDHFNPVDHATVVQRYAHNKNLKIVVRPEIQSRLAGLEAGEIDTVPELGPDNVRPYLDDPDFSVQFQPAGPWTIQNLHPNLFPETMADGSPNPFLDLRVRQAANHAINRQAMIDNLLLGQGTYPLFAFSGVPGYPSPEQKQDVQYDYDPERARQLLAEAGYADGFDIPLYWASDWGGAYEADLVLAVVQDLTAVGIRAHEESTLLGEYLTDAYVTGGPGLPPGLYWFWANPVRDVGSMWDCCAGPESYFMKLNGSGVQDPALQELYLAQTTELDPDRRAELITEMFLEHARQAYYVFIVEAPDAVLTRSDVNWPKGGRTGTLWGGTTYAVQRHI